MTIRVGDKVRVTSFELDSEFGATLGETGTARRVTRFSDNNELILVRFDASDTRRDGCEWWVYDCDLEVIESSEAEDDNFSLTLTEVTEVSPSVDAAIQQTSRTLRNRLVENIDFESTPARWNGGNTFISVDEAADDPSDDIFREAEEAEEESPVENATIRAFYG